MNTHPTAENTVAATQAVDAISMRNRQFEACFAAADAARLVDGYFVPDHLRPTASPPGGIAPITGRGALIAMFEAQFRDIGAIHLETMRVEAGADIAYELGRAHLSLRTGERAVGRYTVLWRLVAGEWRAQIDFFTTDGW